MEATTRVLLAILLVTLPGTAQAAPALDGAKMGWFWVLPFVGILLSIAAGPLLFRKLWHTHYGKIAAAWSLVTLIAIAAAFGAPAALDAFVHAMLAEYLNFIILLFALYTVAGGLLITGDLGGRPWSNTLVLAAGTGIASIVGTTGAAMILVRPLIRANAARKHNMHVFVFFIFVVCNLGGALTPLGDPPLLVGFLHGVDFTWPTVNLWQPTLTAAVVLLGVFFGLDTFLDHKDPPALHPRARLKAHALINVPLIAGIIGAILLVAFWHPEISFEIYGTRLALENLVCDALLVGIALLSLWLTPDEHREANGFTWEPISEVAKLFAAIFICIIPVLAMLQAGHAGAFAFLLRAVTEHDGMPNEQAYFWLSGGLSAFLDNAPTYLVFFQLAGGNAQELMTTLSPTLAAISMGAVYMGALTYIGNAPNFMVAAIAREAGIEMPTFFGYMLWSCAILLPLFALVSLVFVG